MFGVVFGDPSKGVALWWRLPVAHGCDETSTLEAYRLRHPFYQTRFDLAVSFSGVPAKCLREHAVEECGVSTDCHVQDTTDYELSLM